MDKKRPIIIKSILIIIFLVLFIGTLERFNIISFENNNLPELISLNRYEFGIKKNTSYKMEASIYPIDSYKGKIKWHSSNPSILEVSEDGMLYGKVEGDVIVTASIPYNNMKTEATVHVTNEDIPMDSFILTTNEIYMVKDSEYNINYQIYPLNSNSNNLYFVSSDNSIINVDNTGHIFANELGKAYIKIYTINGKEDILTVNVIDKINNKKINLDKKNYNLNVGSKVRIKLDNNYYLESLNPNIVKVNNKEIEALNIGNTQVLIKGNNKNIGIININVINEKINITDIDIKEKELSLYVNDTYELTINTYPVNATNENLIYSVSDNSILTITNGIVKGIKEGTARIKVENKDSNVYNTVIVNVYENPDIIEVENIDINEEDITMYVGSSKNINYLLEPVNANQELNWSSSDNNVVLVDNGIIRAINRGEATIYVNVNDMSDSISVKVIDAPLLSINISDENIYLKPGETHALKIGFVPNNASDLGLEFISENENVATIKDGVIKANDIGNTLILIKNKDIIKEINVEVR